LPHSPFSRSDSDLVRHAAEHFRARTGARRRLLLARGHVEGDVDAGNTVQGTHGRLGVARDLLAELWLFGLKADDEGHFAAVDLDVMDEIERHDVAGEAGEPDLLQRLENLILTW